MSGTATNAIKRSAGAPRRGRKGRSGNTIGAVPESVLFNSLTASHSLKHALAEQPGRADVEKRDGEEIRKPRRDATADKRADISFGQVLGRTDDQPAHDGAADGSEAADDQDRQGFEHHQGQRG